MNLYEQAEGESPVQWIERVLRTIALRLAAFAVGMFLLGYFFGEKV